MGREIITEADIERWRRTDTGHDAMGGTTAGVRSKAAANGEGAPPPKKDEFADRLLKYIPAEVVAVYITLDALFRTAPPHVPKQGMLWLVFIVLTLGTWFYMARVQAVKKVEQLVISTGAFVVWVFSLGGPFAAYDWYSPFYGGVVLPLYTFVTAIIAPKK